MARGTKREAVATAAESSGGIGSGGGLTELELGRAAIIARNRERLMALGIPALRKELEAAGGSGRTVLRKRAKAEVDEYMSPRVKWEVGVERPTRRSARLQEAQEHPRKHKPESALEPFERELGGFILDGACPRCGLLLERAHHQHLLACLGPKPARRAAAAPAPRMRDAVPEELDEEERQDVHKRLLARMTRLHLDGITELTDVAAKFVVLGSTGKHYTITLTDPKHTCTCPDHRFRRHDCKHICLVLQQLGIMDCAHKEWKAAVEQRMDQLVQVAKEQAHLRQTESPHSKEVALKLL